jgi:hypothetical protein
MSVESILAAHTVQREALATRIILLLEREWSSLGSWDLADVESFIGRAVPIVTGGQAMTARMTDVYISQILTEMTGEQIRTVGLRQSDLAELRGVPLTEVYRRPFVELWAGLKEGKLFADALATGMNRVSELADDDLSLAYRKASTLAFGKQTRVKGYRRVVRPEFSKGGTCPLCHLAAENRYHKSDLLPIHTHCRCAVMPIVGKSDPGASLNEADLGQLEKPDVHPVVRNHGELGPILQIAGEHFTTEAQVA